MIHPATFLPFHFLQEYSLAMSMDTDIFLNQYFLPPFIFVHTSEFDKIFCPNDTTANA